MGVEQSLQWPKSLWVSTAGSTASLPQVTEDIFTDLLIVGGGYTGLSTALNSKSLFQKIAVIDQAQPGWGCSGRNGGQINPQWKSSLAHLQSQYTAAEFKNFITLLDGSTDEVFGFINQYDIDCNTQRNGALIPARGSASVNYLREWANYWQAYGANVQFLNQSDTVATIGTEAYDACLSMNSGGSLQPLLFTRGLLRACQSESVRVYGNTSAQNVATNDNGWVVSTEQGNIFCNALVIATNGYTKNLWPGLSQAILPVASMISATAPLPIEMTKSILPGKQCVAEYAGLPYYYRLDENDRLVMGGRGTRTGEIGSVNPTHLRQAAINLFPCLNQTQWEFDWAGYVGITPHQKPMLVRLGENAYAGLGYNGRGITMATAMGKQLSQALAGENTLLPVEKLKTIPFHRFRSAGIACRILYGQFKDRLSGLR